MSPSGRHRAFLGFQVDAQLSDLVDVLGVADGRVAPRYAPAGHAPRPSSQDSPRLAARSGVPGAAAADAAAAADDRSEWGDDGGGVRGGSEDDREGAGASPAATPRRGSHASGPAAAHPRQHAAGHLHADSRAGPQPPGDSTATGDPGLERGRQLLAGGQALHAGLDPWEVAAASGATNAGLLPPPPLRTHRWAFPEQNAHDQVRATRFKIQ
jgi:hypothetical protein